jgi:hypothetical protein
MHKCGASDCNKMIDDPYKFCSIECAGYSEIRRGAGVTYCRDCGTILPINEPCYICGVNGERK